MKKFEFDWKVIIIMLVVAPILVNFLMKIPSKLAVGDASAWIGFFGNYSGGILGGIVAYIISKKQFDLSKENDKRNRYIAQLPTLVKLGYELDRLNKQLVILHNLSKQGNFPNGLTLEKIKIGKTEIEPINDEYWTDLSSIFDIKLLKDIIEYKESYNKIVEILAFDLNEVNSQINSKNVRIDQLQSKATKSKKDQQEINGLMTELMPLVQKSNLWQDNKEKVWEDISKSTFLQFPNSLQTQISTVIEDIEKLLNS